MESEIQPIPPTRPTITTTEKIRYEVTAGSQPDTYQVRKDIWEITLYNRAGVMRTSTNRTSLDFMV
jgi:hypothetical protein